MNNMKNDWNSYCCSFFVFVMGDIIIDESTAKRSFLKQFKEKINL